MGVSGILVIVVITLLFINWFRNKSPPNYPPGYKGLPLLGVLPWVGDNPAVTFMEWGRKLGPVFSVRMGNETMIVLNSYEAIYEAFKNNGKSAPSRPKMQIFEEARVSMGLVFREYGDEYVNLKKIMQSSLKKFLLADSDKTDLKFHDEIELLSKEILKHNGEAMYVKKCTSDAIASILCQVIFGKRFEYENKQFRGLMSGMKKLYNNLDDGLYINLLTLVYSLKHFPIISGVHKRFMDTWQERMEIFHAIIKEHRTNWNGSDVKDLIEMFFLLQQNEPDNSAYKNTELPDLIADMLDAGSETSSTTIRWCLMYLANHEKTQNKLVGEIEREIGDKMVQYKHKDTMPLMTSYINEVVRHRTIAPLGIIRKTTADMKVLNYSIPKASKIIPNIWAVHHDPDNFSDPDVIKPERFINQETGKFVNPSKFFPFSLGVRKCPGNQLAERALFLFVTSVLQRFELREDTEFPLPDFNEGIASFNYFHKDFKMKFIPRNTKLLKVNK